MRLTFSSKFLTVVMLGLLAGALTAQDTNIASLGVAEQSTTGFGGGPERAIDGNTDGVYPNGSVSHTETGDLMPLWRLDLLDTFPLTRIVLWNRTDCCSERLSDFNVSVLDEEQAVLYTDTFFIDGTFPETNFEIVLPEDTIGQFVEISLNPLDPPVDRFLSLAEVQVFTSDPVDLPPTIDTHPAGGRVDIGVPFEFTVVASGNDLTYEWAKDGTPIPGATDATYSIASVDTDDAGVYNVTVRNGAGEITSNDAVLNVRPGTNLALCGTATQSTVGFGGTPERAIDGDVNGFYGGGSITHTAADDPAPWWEVSLAESSEISSILIWNRYPADCCAERLSNFLVSIIDEDDDLVFEEVYFDDGFSFPDTTVMGFEVELGGTVTGKVVRIELLDVEFRDPAQTFLSLAEVEVFGTGAQDCVPPLNPSLAHRDEATVSQSTTLGGFVPELAVDDNLGNFTHTVAADEAPFWQVDLGSVQTIAEIVLVNRANCCASRLRDITVFVLDGPGGEVVFQSALLNPENELGGGVAQVGPPELLLSFEPPIDGQIVRVERAPDLDFSGAVGGEDNPDEATVLSLAEVYVYPPTECEQGDTHCAGVEVIEAPPEGEPGLHRLEIESTDDGGDVITHFVSVINTERPNDPPIEITTTDTVVALNLGYGLWEVTVVADDGQRCETPAEDNTCTLAIDIPVDPCLLSLDPAAVATQSTLDFGGTPDRAIDGNTDGIYGNGSQTHTAPGDPDPWWEVDLGGMRDIGRIVLWNRTEACCSGRLTNFRVAILDGDRNLVYEDFHFEDPGAFPDTTVEGYAIDLPGGRSGQIVRVDFVEPELRDPAGLFLTLAEVQVYCADGAPPPEQFKRGDADGVGVVNLTDGIFLLNFLFLGGPTPPCEDAADVNDDGALNITTAVYLFNFLFLGGPRPPAPGSADCGPDTVADDLTCLGYDNC